jgi:hypothetical protein
MSAKDWRGLGPGQMDSTRLGNGAHGRRWTDMKVIARAVGVGARRESCRGDFGTFVSPVLLSIGSFHKGRWCLQRMTARGRESASAR